MSVSARTVIPTTDLVSGTVPVTVSCAATIGICRLRGARMVSGGVDLAVVAVGRVRSAAVSSSIRGMVDVIGMVLIADNAR